MRCVANNTYCIAHFTKETLFT